MALTRGSLGGHEFERMVVLFSMVDGERQIPCAVSTSAMDELEKPITTKPDQFLFLGYFSILLSLGGCGGAELECDSLESRKSVVKIIADDNDNALVNYAANNSSVVAAMVGSANTEADRLIIFDKAKRDAVYKLDETIRINSKNRAAHLVTCSGILDVTVADTTAEKQVDFRVEQAADGKMSVSVDPFLF